MKRTVSLGRTACSGVDHGRVAADDKSIGKPMDVSDIGRLAVFSDMTEAVFRIWHLIAAAAPLFRLWHHRGEDRSRGRLRSREALREALGIRATSGHSLIATPRTVTITIVPTSTVWSRSSRRHLA
jgi:hypothetical protein